LARLSGLPLDDLQALVATGYFRQWRARGLSLRGIGARLHKSLRTTATLSAKAGADGALTALSKRIGWRRKLVARVAELGSCERRQLGGVVRGERRAEVERELDQLVEEGVLTEQDGSLAVAVQYLSLLGDNVDARLDSLRHFLDATTHVIYQRFFAPDAAAVALARVLSFRAEQGDLSALRDEAYAALRDRVVAVDARAGADARAASIAFCVSEVPASLAIK
jgi:hypothetical protein